MENEPIAIFAGAAVSALLLALEHYALWPYRDQIAKLHAYVIGVGTMGLGIALTSSLLADWRIFIVFMAVAGAGGVAVAGGYWLRSLNIPRRRDRAARIIARAEEQLRATSAQHDDRHN